MVTVNQITALAIVCLLYFSQSMNARLIQLNVIFRHGDRTPEHDGGERFPSDPYANESFFPYGQGALTNKGKLREFKIGEYLRYQYDDFLGDTYLPPEVKARSTAYDRTKMSLLLALAGLYPPDYYQQWNPRLDWQPIPTEYVPVLDDTLMQPMHCPKFLNARERAERSQDFQQELSTFDSLMKNLTEFTGQNITTSSDMFSLYLHLQTESAMGYELPEWTEGIFPYGRLHDAAVLEYDLQSWNDELKRLNGGMLLRKITDDMTDSSRGKANPKVYLYSGHETNLAAVLHSLGIYYPHVPRFSSAIIFELHEHESKYHFVRVRYYRGFIRPGTGEILDQVMQIPDCRKFCPLPQFKQLLSNAIAKDSDIKCDQRSLKGYLESGKSTLPLGIIRSHLGRIYREESLRNKLQ